MRVSSVQVQVGFSRTRVGNKNTYENSLLDVGRNYTQLIHLMPPC